MAVWFRDEGAWFLDVPGFGVWCSGLCVCRWKVHGDLEIYAISAEALINRIGLGGVLTQP